MSYTKKIVFLSLFLLIFVAAEALEPRSITVTGNAEVNVVPDEVVLLFGVETIDREMSEAKAQNDESVRKVLALADKYDIDSQDVQTDHIAINPRYTERGRGDEIESYAVRKSILFRLKDISKFEDLLSDALAAGVNYVQDIQFGHSELKQYQDEVRRQAILNAKEKAEKIAQELDQKVGKPKDIREQQTRHGTLYEMLGRQGWRGRGVMGASVSATGVDSASESTIALGEITISTRFTVSFILDDK
jgi:hypothetical protein